MAAPTEQVKNQSSTWASSTEVEMSICRACGRSHLTKAIDSTSQDNVLCTACKKFYARYHNKIQEKACSCIGNMTGGNNNCRFCRYQRCKATLLGEKALSKDHQLDLSMERVDFTSLPCAVCGHSSNGFHFGVVCCEGCKTFFRRSMKRTFKLQYKCKASNKDQSPKKLCQQSSNCRKCRFERCLDVGMSLKGTEKWRRRVEIGATVRKHCAEGSFLKSKILRRKRPIVGNDSSKIPASSPPLSPIDSGIADTSSFEHQNGSLNNTGDISKSTTLSSPQLSIKDDYYGATYGSDESNLIERTVEAAARLSTISTLRLSLNYEMTHEEMASKRINLLECYVKCVGEFITYLPGINRVSLPDRVHLFAQAFFPLSIAQLSLNFDVEKQITNHFSIEREGPTWEICRNDTPEWDASESFLSEAGNLLSKSIVTLKEFSLCCALLFFNTGTPNLENAEGIRVIRQRYELATLHYFSSVSSDSAQIEERLSKFYHLLSYLRRSTTLIQNVFMAVAAISQQVDEMLWTPLFRQLFWQILSLPPLSSANTVQNQNNV